MEGNPWNRDGRNFEPYRKVSYVGIANHRKNCIPNIASYVVNVYVSAGNFPMAKGFPMVAADVSMVEICTFFQCHRNFAFYLHRKQILVMNFSLCFHGIPIITSDCLQ